jgi:radical SAM superfamily enzyme YgiQ (UPF0313 family)
MGILYLASALRARLGGDVEVSYRDMRLERELPEALAAEIAGRYDLVGISALNCEAEVVRALAKALRVSSPAAVIAMGGPYARNASAADMADMDWVFCGEADRSFPQAVEAHFFGRGGLGSVPGLTWRVAPEGPLTANGGEDYITDLDTLPLPAWDLVPFDTYARRHNMNGSLRAARYAPLFTSRGCPYRCNYCHNLFGKTTRWRSAESVLGEIELLKSRYGVNEFQIIDDIYNLDKRRMRGIAAEIIRRYGRRELFFTFPNGVRGDILDTADLPLLRDMGVYDITFAIETASPRLQKLINKNLDVAKVGRAMDAAAAAGISVKGFFMLGFPTETAAELESTVRFALESRLTIAHFFFVMPQPGTPLHALAERESPTALQQATLGDYYEKKSWYERAYGFDLDRLRRDAVYRFYLRPGRLLRVLRRTNFKQLLLGEWRFFKLIAKAGGEKGTAQ